MSLFQYRLKWLESGGFRKNELPYTIAKYPIHANDIKPFYLGDDNCVEPGIDEEDLQTDEVCNVTVDSSQVQDEEEFVGTRLVSRKNRVRKRRRVEEI